MPSTPVAAEVPKQFLQPGREYMEGEKRVCVGEEAKAPLPRKSPPPKQPVLWCWPKDSQGFLLKSFPTADEPEPSRWRDDDGCFFKFPPHMPPAEREPPAPPRPLFKKPPGTGSSTPCAKAWSLPARNIVGSYTFRTEVEDWPGGGGR